jgi:hypothetical protein
MRGTLRPTEILIKARQTEAGGWGQSPYGIPLQKGVPYNYNPPNVLILTTIPPTPLTAADRAGAVGYSEQRSAQLTGLHRAWPSCTGPNYPIRVAQFPLSH